MLQEFPIAWLNSTGMPDLVDVYHNQCAGKTLGETVQILQVTDI